METVHDHFNLDFPHVISYETEVEIELSTLAGQLVSCRFPCRTYADYNANSVFLAAYMQDDAYVMDLAESFLQHAQEVAANRPRSVLSSGRAGDPLLLGNELQFTGRVFLYIDSELSEADIAALVAVGKKNGLTPIVRCRRYAAARTREEKPLAFISYDSGDRENVAKPLALRLAAFGCPVWFDEFSLKMGDSLRESIERGLRECEKCVLIISPHFLANTGWTKTEFNAIFMREVHERQHVILPVWVGVTDAQVYAYSPTLADRRAINWNRGLDEVVHEIRKVIGP